MLKIIDHYAFLVESLDESLIRLKEYGYENDTYEVFESEGTKEAYISMGHESGKLLLMEAVSEGPYLKAKSKRGTGLHHIAIKVENLSLFLGELKNSGWYMHLHSFEAQKYNTIWLARPGTPLLLEISEAKSLCEKNAVDYFIRSADLSLLIDPKLISALNLPELSSSKDNFHLFHTEQESFKGF